MKLKKCLFWLVIIICVSSCKSLPIPNEKPLDNIVLVSGDTLYGKVDYFKERFVFSEFYKKIRLIDTNGRKRRFKRKKVLSYRVDGYDYESYKLDQETKLFRNGRYLDTRYYIDRDGVQHFLKVTRKGKLSLYELEWIDLDNNNLRSVYLIKKAGDKSFISASNMLGRVAKKNS